jgi:hypothetical protein
MEKIEDSHVEFYKVVMEYCKYLISDNYEVHLLTKSVLEKFSSNIGLKMPLIFFITKNKKETHLRKLIKDYQF